MVPLDAEEAERVRVLAARLGIPAPLDGGALRRNMGRCCLWAEGVGCRLHAAFGAAAKPHVCRQFPFVRAGEALALDPTCPHPVPGDPPEVAVHGVAAPRGPLPGTLQGQMAQAGLSLAGVAARWRAVPWGPWREVADLGAPLREALAQLQGLPPPSTAPAWPEGAGRVGVAWRFRLVADDALEDLVAGAVVIAGAGERDELLAAWLKLLR